MIDNRILNAVSWIFLVIFIVFVLWYIFGNSPIELALFIPFAVLFFSKFWTMSNDLSHLNGDYAQFKENVKESFQRARKNDEEIKQDIKEIKKVLGKKYGR